MSASKLVSRLLLAGALALPTAAAAAEGAAPSPAPENEATCNVRPDLGADRAELMTRLQARLLEEQALSGEDVVVLNGRGYRYDNAPGFARDLQMLELEIARARAAAKAKQAAPKP
jgi:hypothetical protein